MNRSLYRWHYHWGADRMQQVSGANINTNNACNVSPKFPCSLLGPAQPPVYSTALIISNPKTH